MPCTRVGAELLSFDHPPPHASATWPSTQEARELLAALLAAPLTPPYYAAEAGALPNGDDDVNPFHVPDDDVTAMCADAGMRVQIHRVMRRAPRKTHG